MSIWKLSTDKVLAEYI